MCTRALLTCCASERERGAWGRRYIRVQCRPRRDRGEIVAFADMVIFALGSDHGDLRPGVPAVVGDRAAHGRGGHGPRGPRRRSAHVNSVGSADDHLVP